MWLVGKNGDGTEPDRIELPHALAETLELWYEGAGSNDDEDASIVLVQQARRNQKWLACHCLGSANAPPLLSPAFLAIADTYYLRRLTGKGRAVHRADCPYFREQAPPRIRERLTAATHRNPTDGFFEVMRPIPEHLAQSPTYASPDDRTRGASVPRLARLLWQLLDTAKRNIVYPINTTKGQGKRSIAIEFAAIRAAAKLISVAPDVRLADVLFTHPDAYLKRQVIGRLHALERRWPSGHAPQAFLLLFTNAVRGNTLYLPGGRTITTTSRIKSDSTRASPVHGPFLTLVVVGRHPDAHAYEAIGAFAQPIHSGMRFLPVTSDADRATIKAIDEVRWKLHLGGVDLQMTIPLFDTLIDNVEVRPAFVIDALDRRTGELDTIIFDDPSTEADISGDHGNDTKRKIALSKIGRVVDATPSLAREIGPLLEALLDRERAGKRTGND